MVYVPPQDRVRETSTTTGTGDLALSATSDYRRFSNVAAAGDTVDYAVILGSSWEVGVNALGTGATSLVRTASGVRASSNGGNLVNFGAGVKDVFMSIGAHVANAMLRAPIVLPVTANRNVVTSDRNRLLSCAIARGSTLTLTLPAGSTVGPEFALLVESTNYGGVYLQPSSGTIDGKAFIPVFKGQAAFWVVTDGANWRTVGRQSVFTIVSAGAAANVAAVDFTFPEGMKRMDFVLSEVGPMSAGSVALKMYLYDAAGAIITGASAYLGSYILNGSSSPAQGAFQDGNGFFVGGGQLQAAQAPTALVGRVNIARYGGTSINVQSSYYNPVTGAHNNWCAGGYLTSGVATGARLVYSSGTMGFSQIDLVGYAEQ